MLRQVLALAIEDKRLARNPCAGVKAPRRQHRPRGYLTHAQVEALASDIADSLIPTPTALVGEHHKRRRDERRRGEMADDAEKKQSWWLTLPGILTAIGTFIGAITGLVAVLNQVGVFRTPVPPTTTSAPAPPPTTVNSSGPPPGVPLIALPTVGADWQGFPPPAYARCLGGDAAAAIGETNQSKLVVCRRDATHLYYRGMANSGGVIQLDAVPGPPSSRGFDATNSTDGTEYQIRPDSLTISMPGKAPWSEPMLQYSSS